MRTKTNRILHAAFALLALATASAHAQAVFDVGSSALVAADIGHTELTGPISLIVKSGATVEAPFVVTYSALITNNAASEIHVSGTGGLAGIPTVPILDRVANAIVIQVPAGGVAGDMILISGARITAAGLNISQVNARITGVPNGNSIAVGQDFPVVIGSLAKPFSMDESAPPLSFDEKKAVRDSASFRVIEGFKNAFAGVEEEGGRTLASRIRITPFPSIPEGISVTFDALALSNETGAAFRTLSGNAETVPRPDGSADVVFEFIPAAGSHLAQESFLFSVKGTMLNFLEEPAVIPFQAALVPIGRAVPEAQFPSEDIPRYEERLVPEESELKSGTTELVFPFRIESDGVYTGIAVTNPNNFAVSVALTAYDAGGSVIAGTGIQNPVAIRLPANGNYGKVAYDIFGSSFNASSAGTIRAVGGASNLRGFYLMGDLDGPRLDGGDGVMQGIKLWRLPLVFREGKNPYNLLEIYNPGGSDTTVSLRLLDEDGVEVAAAARVIGAGKTLMEDIKSVFGIGLGSFQGGYIRGESDVPLVVRGNFGNTLDSNVLKAQGAASRARYYLPHFASGGPYSTELTLVNLSPSSAVELTLSLLDEVGAAMPVDGNPAVLNIPAQKQWTRTIADLFPALGPSLKTGALKIEPKHFFSGPIVMAPPLIGAVRFAASDGSASAAIPFALSPSLDITYSHVAQQASYFTGVVLMNANAQAANYSIDVFNNEGVTVGSFCSRLQPWERMAKLVYELIPASAGQLGGHIRIRSDLRLTSFALFGTSDVRSLSAIPSSSR
jgi:hypothetical protein